MTRTPSSQGWLKILTFNLNQDDVDLNLALRLLFHKVMFNKKAPCVYVNQQRSVFDPDL